jgi:hypothetical protein
MMRASVITTKTRHFIDQLLFYGAISDQFWVAFHRDSASRYPGVYPRLRNRFLHDRDRLATCVICVLLYFTETLSVEDSLIHGLFQTDLDRHDHRISPRRTSLSGLYFCLFCFLC